MIETIDQEDIDIEKSIISIYMKNIKDYLETKRKPIIL